MMATTFAKFGPDPPFSTLPQDFQDCITASRTTTPIDGCDTTVGGAISGQTTGYCMVQPAGSLETDYSQTTFCACVNNAISCPEFSVASCADAENAYIPTEMALGGSDYTKCKGQPICVNLVDIGGSSNLASNITQECGVITNIYNTITASPALAAIVFVLVLALIILMMSRTDEDYDQFDDDIPPPPPGIFS